jgi:hypothetical protein
LASIFSLAAPLSHPVAVPEKREKMSRISCRPELGKKPQGLSFPCDAIIVAKHLRPDEIVLNLALFIFLAPPG